MRVQLPRQDCHSRRRVQLRAGVQLHGLLVRFLRRLRLHREQDLLLVASSRRVLVLAEAGVNMPRQSSEIIMIIVMVADGSSIMMTPSRR